MTMQSMRTNTIKWLLLACAIFGFAASFVLTYDKIQLLKDPANVPACSINPIITCVSAMNSAQAETFGIPNSLMGIVAYTALITLAVLLLAGSKLNRRLWYAVLVSAATGLAFMHYLLIQSVFFLHIICPWCFGVWLTTPIIFVAVARLFCDAGLASSLPRPLASTLSYIARRAGTVLAVWYVGLAATLLIVFWEFWSTLLPL